MRDLYLFYIMRVCNPECIVSVLEFSTMDVCMHICLAVYLSVCLYVHVYVTSASTCSY